MRTTSTTDGAMTPRDRVRAVYALRPPDRVPVTELCVNHPVASALLGREAWTGFGGYVRGKLANLHRDLGSAYEGAGLLEPAIEQFRQALELCPTFVDIRTKLGTMLRDAGMIDAAIDELTAVRDANPEYLPARVHLGVTLWSAGRREEAAVEWRAVLAQDPDNRSVRVYLRMVEDVPAT